MHESPPRELSKITGITGMSTKYSCKNEYIYNIAYIYHHENLINTLS